MSYVLYEKKYVLYENLSIFVFVFGYKIAKRLMWVKLGGEKLLKIKVELSELSVLS